MRPRRSGAGRLAAKMGRGRLLGVLPVMAASGAIAWLRPPQVFSAYSALLHAPLGPLQLAFGGALTGIAAAIAGAIAAKIFADRRPTAAPASKGAQSGARPSGARQDAGSDDGEVPARSFGPPPPPARVRLALPPEQPAAPETPSDEEMPGTPHVPSDEAAGRDAHETGPSA